MYYHIFMSIDSEAYFPGIRENESRFSTIGEIRDRYISKWLLKLLKKEDESKKHSKEHVRTFNQNVAEEIRLFSYDVDKKDPNNPVLKKIVKAKALELLRASIEQGFDSQQTITTIGRELQTRVTPFEPTDKEDLNKFLNRYYEYRERVLKIYRTFLYSKELIRSFITGRSKTQGDVTLGPFGIEVSAPTEVYQKITKNVFPDALGTHIGLSFSNINRNILDFKNSSGILNVIFVDSARTPEEMDETRQHERSHAFFDLAFQGRNRKFTQTINERIGNTSAYFDQIKDGTLRQESKEDILKNYNYFISQYISFYNHSYCTETFAFVFGPLRRVNPAKSNPQVQYEPITWHKPISTTLLPKENNVLSLLNPHRQESVNSRGYYLPSTDIVGVFDSDLYNYLKTTKVDVTLREYTNNNIVGLMGVTQEELDEEYKNAIEKRMLLIRKLKLKINLFFMYYPEQRGTMIYYLIDNLDFDEWPQMMDDYIENISRSNPADLQRWQKLKNMFDTANSIIINL